MSESGKCLGISDIDVLSCPVKPICPTVRKGQGSLCSRGGFASIAAVAAVAAERGLLAPAASFRLSRWRAQPDVYFCGCRRCVMANEINPNPVAAPAAGRRALAGQFRCLSDRWQAGRPRPSGNGRRPAAAPVRSGVPVCLARVIRRSSNNTCGREDAVFCGGGGGGCKTNINRNRARWCDWAAV